MHEFFVPFAPGAGGDESVYHVLLSAVRRRLGRTPGERRVRRVESLTDGGARSYVVGQRDSASGETVLAILECGGAYLVCTRTHGLTGGPPVEIDGATVVDVEDFA